MIPLIKKICIFSVLIILITGCPALAKYNLIQQFSINGNIVSVEASPNNQTLAAVLKENKKKRLLIFEKQGNWYPEEHAISCKYNHYKFSCDWQHLVVSADENNVILYSKKEGTWCSQTISDVGPVYDFAFSDLNEYLFIRTNDTIKVFYTADCTETDFCSILNILRSSKHKNINFCGYKISLDSKSIAAINARRNELSLYQQHHEEPQILTFGQNKISKYSFSPNGQILAVVTSAGNLILFRRNNDEIWNLFQEINKNIITHFCFSQNGIAILNYTVQWYTTQGGNPLAPDTQRHYNTTYYLTTFNYENGLFVELNNYSSSYNFQSIFNRPIIIRQSNSSIQLIQGYDEHWKTSNTYAHNNHGAFLSKSGNELIILSSKTQSLDIYKIDRGQINSLPITRIRCPDFFSQIYDVDFLDNTDIVIRLNPNSPWFYGENSNQIIILREREIQMKNATK